MSNILISDSTHTYQSLREKKLEKIIDNDGFGKIHIINMNIFWNSSQEYYDNEKWRGTKKIDGGIFYNQTSHHLDLLINLFGPLVKVSSFLSKNRKNIEVEDTAVVSLLFKSGLVGSINVSMLIHFGNYETSLTLVGDKGTLKIDGKNLNIIEYWSFKTILVIKLL